MFTKIKEVSKIGVKCLTYDKFFMNTVEKFLENFEDCSTKQIGQHFFLNFEIENTNYEKSSCALFKIATEEDAEAIVEICKDVYKGTYPYKEMEDVKAVRHILKKENQDFLLFKDQNDEIVGCYGCAVNFEDKRGYIKCIMLREKLQKRFDIKKAIVGAFYWIWNKYKDKIWIWYMENRTNNSAIQFLSAICGVHTMGILPNKDIFHNKVESDVFAVSYSDKVLRHFRSKKKSKIIKEAEKCFIYSDSFYELGDFDLFTQEIDLDPDLISNIKEKIIIKKIKKKFGYQKICFLIPNSKSFFTFLYTKHLKNFEKTKYKVNNLEELAAFLLELNEYIEKLKIRYCEVFVSAYSPEHQHLFLEAGFFPRGYIPCWEHNKMEGVFEDNIIFNYFNGDINNISLFEERKNILEKLNIFSGEIIYSIERNKGVMKEYIRSKEIKVYIK